MYRCPKCKATDGLEVTVQVWAELIQNGKDGEDFETDTTTPDDGDHEWDSDSAMKCTHCGHRGRAGEFNAEDWDEPLCADVRCTLPAGHTGPCEEDDDGEDEAEFCECGRETGTCTYSLGDDPDGDHRDK